MRMCMPAKRKCVHGATCFFVCTRMYHLIVLKLQLILQIGHLVLEVSPATRSSALLFDQSPVYPIHSVTNISKRPCTRKHMTSQVHASESTHGQSCGPGGIVANGLSLELGTQRHQFCTQNVGSFLQIVVFLQAPRPRHKSRAPTSARHNSRRRRSTLCALSWQSGSRACHADLSPQVY